MQALILKTPTTLPVDGGCGNDSLDSQATIEIDSPDSQATIEIDSPDSLPTLESDSEETQPYYSSPTSPAHFVSLIIDGADQSKVSLPYFNNFNDPKT